MKFCAIICEYNPLHNGHIYQIKKARELTNMPVLCMMSGNFTQRGIPALISKKTRAKEAILAGANIVLELPTIYAISCAEIFAKKAIELLLEMPVTHLCFGAEHDSLDDLQKIANFLANESEAFKIELKKLMKTGKTYHACLIEAVSKNIEDLPQNTLDIISKPNNILAIEYLKAIKNTTIKPILIKREDNYNNEEIDKQQKFASATAIRKAVNENNLSKIKNYVPEFVLEDLKNYSFNFNRFNDIILFKLRTCDTNWLGTVAEVNEGLEYRISKIANESNDFETFLQKVATKRYKMAKIRRIALYAYLNITKEDIMLSNKVKPYTNLLAKKPWVSLDEFYQNENLTVICTYKQMANLNDQQRKLYSCNAVADALYDFCITKK